VEKAGVERSGVDSRGGKCRNDNGWKAARKEKYEIPTTSARSWVCVCLREPAIIE